MSDLQAWDVLRDYQKQCDADGVEVQVSRQAVDETLTALHTAFDRIEELEADLKAWQKFANKADMAMDRLEAENERLRAALNQIAELPSHRNPCCPTNPAKAIARDALAAAQENDYAR